MYTIYKIINKTCWLVTTCTVLANRFFTCKDTVEYGMNLTLPKKSSENLPESLIIWGRMS